ncbi:MAG: hypothetical protein LWX09_12525 [Bacteroidia bacterium]|nr:hypothetical protein [Bacteroidia bacterium]
MKTTNKKAFQKFLLLSIILLSGTIVFGQNSYEVKPIKSYYQPYKGKHQIILESIMNDPNLSIEEKLIKYDEAVKKLKQEFKSERIQEYKSKSIELNVGHSCTSKTSGRVKDCGYKYLKAPNKNMYTAQKWVRHEGTSKGIEIAPDGSYAGIKMTVAGKGKNSGILYAKFYYRPNKITELVDKETVDLFNMIFQ